MGLVIVLIGAGVVDGVTATGTGAGVESRVAGVIMRRCYAISPYLTYMLVPEPKAAQSD